jgi:hypothetical protein
MEIEIINNHIYRDNEAIGDLKTNEATPLEIQLLKELFEIEINRSGVTHFVCSKSKLQELINNSIGILIFRDINGNFNKNFNIDLEL